MLVEIKISYDPSRETLEQAIATLNLKAPAANLNNEAAKPALETPKPDPKPEPDENPAPQETSTPEPKAEENKPRAQATVTKTDIRAIATAISKAGKKAELKAALEAFGATKLSDVNEADYPALKERLEAINA